MTPGELVEAACRARWDAEGSTFTGYSGDVARTWDALAALFPAEAETRRSVERHALAAVLPEIQAQALSGARAELQAAYRAGPGARLDGMPATWRKGMARAHRIVRDYQRSLTTTTGEPTT